MGVLAGFSRQLQRIDYAVAAAARANAKYTSGDGGTARVLIDLHSHTAEGSDDSTLQLHDLVRGAGRAGLDGVCITDHDRFWLPEALGRSAGHASVRVFPGAEINTDAGHALVFGLQGYEFGFHHPHRLAEAVDAAGGAMVFAHPYRRMLPRGNATSKAEFERAMQRALENPLIPLVHGIEIANGRASDLERRFAERLAEEAGLPTVGASDAHRLEDIGRFATRFPTQVTDLSALIEALRAGAMSAEYLPRG